MFTVTTIPANSGQVDIFNSTHGLNPPTGAAAGSVGDKRGMYENMRLRGTTYVTDQNVTVKLDYLINGAFVNVPSFDQVVTAGTPFAAHAIEPESTDYRVYILAGATAPSAHTSTWSLSEDLEV